MRFLNKNVLLILICFILGVFLGFYLPISFPLMAGIAGFFVLYFLFCYLKAKRRIFQNRLFSLAVVFVFISLGCVVTKIHSVEAQPQHYLFHRLAKNSIINFKITESLKPNEYSYNYLAEVKSIDKRTASGKVLFSLGKDSTQVFQPEIGDRYYFYGKLSDVYEPLNPHQFNYKKYLADQQVYKQIKAQHLQLQFIDSDKKQLSSFAVSLRKKIIYALEANGFSNRQVGLMEALLLGQKDHLSKEVYEDFTAAGLVHILAVSGLHVGIILHLLRLLLKPLFRRKNHVLKTVIEISLLIFYAYLVGLSPSVLRAVIMFSFVAVGLSTGRNSSVLTMLGLSAVTMLLYNPYYIWDVGFQLSYTAVFSIVCFQPYVLQLYRPKPKITLYFWKILSVSICAQIGVLPFILYYFHQFPGLFFIGNILVLPVLGIIIAGGILTIILSLTGLLFPGIQRIYGSVLDFLLWGIHQLAFKKSFLIEQIYFSEHLLVLSFSAILLLLFSLVSKKKSYLYLFFVSVIILQVNYFLEQKSLAKNEFMVLHTSRTSTLIHQKKYALKIFSNVKERKIESSKMIANLKTAKGIQQVTVEDSVASVYQFNQQKLLVIDDKGFEKLSQFLQPDFILLRNSPQINLERTIDSLKPAQIIVDGSNYKTYVKRWEITAKNKKVPFHYTGKKGAFRIEY